MGCVRHCRVESTSLAITAGWPHSFCGRGQPVAAGVEELLNEAHAAIIDPASQDAALPCLRKQPDGGKLTQVMRECGFRYVEMRLDVSHPAAVLPRFHKILENLQPVGMAKFRKATGRFAEPKRHGGLIQFSRIPAKKAA